MNSLMYDHLMLPLCETWRIRCVAIDRRGFGKTEWRGTNPVGDVGYDTFADDTVSVLEQLKLGSFVFVAASMGCGETVLAWERSDFVRKYCKVRSGPPSRLPFDILSFHFYFQRFKPSDKRADTNADAVSGIYLDRPHSASSHSDTR